MHHALRTSPAQRRGPLALLAGAASSAQAQVTLTQTHNLSASGIGSVGYSTFTVTSPGAFTIFTTGTTVDPVLYLVTGTSDAVGAMLERDDDDCAGVPGLCGPSGGYGNAIINGRPLDSGTYTVAVGDYHILGRGGTQRQRR